MTLYAEKLDRLHETIRIAAADGSHSVAFAMDRTGAETVMAIGSGGSAIAAEYFATCRAALGHHPTIVATPLAYVLDAPGSVPSHVWLFSAGGANPDILGAYEHARSIGASVDLITSAPDSELARSVGSQHVHVAPVADQKDGFLATHSLVAAGAKLLLAADHLASGPAPTTRVASLLSGYERWLGKDARAALAAERAVRSPGDVVFVLYDPHARAAASLIETSLWEGGLVPVQLVDFRNFAHGRHVWFSGPRRASIVAVVTDDSRALWHGISESLPVAVARLELSLGTATRANLFGGMLAGFSYIEAIGTRLGIDPGRPGVSDFGRALYAAPSLRTRAPSTLPIRRKMLAYRKTDPVGGPSPEWTDAFSVLVDKLRTARIGGLVLDYDGTVVSTEHRLEAPRAEVVAELVRLIEADLPIAFATGRGGSLGRMLRELLPGGMHERVLIGYYNGGLILPLSVDIEAAPPEQDASISAFFAQLGAHPELFGDEALKLSTRQISIPSGALKDFARGLDELNRLLDLHAPYLRIIQSGHAIDIVPTSSSKRAVVDRLRLSLPAEYSIVSIGDSGDAQGNDFELFEDCIGISVGRVCHRPETGWNLGAGIDEAPLELIRLLRSVTVAADGKATFDVHSLFPLV